MNKIRRIDCESTTDTGDILTVTIIEYDDKIVIHSSNQPVGGVCQNLETVLPTKEFVDLITKMVRNLEKQDTKNKEHICPKCKSKDIKLDQRDREDWFPYHQCSKCEQIICPKCWAKMGLEHGKDIGYLYTKCTKCEYEL